MSDHEFPVIPVTGPQGPVGPQGATGAAGVGVSAFTTVSAQFTMPAVLGTVDVSVGTSEWIAVGQYLFIETAGYFVVTTITDLFTITVQNLDTEDNVAPTTVINAGSKVSPGGWSGVQAADVTAIGDRLTIVEGTAVFTGSEGANTFHGPTEPSGLGEKEGDMWFDTDDNNKPYRYTTGAWTDITKVIDLATETIGVVTETQIGPLAITAPKIAANTITAAQCVAIDFISQSAMIKNAIIVDAHIANVNAAKISVGNLAAINISHAGKIYHPDATSTYFDVTNQGTASDNSHLFTQNLTDMSAGGTTSLGTATPFYCPAHASAAANLSKVICPNSDDEIIFQFHGVLTGYTGSHIALIYRKNGAGNYVVGGYAPSGDGVTYAAIGGTRKWGPWISSDYIEFWICPCDGNGQLAADVTCNVQLDVMVQNF